MPDFHYHASIDLGQAYLKATLYQAESESYKLVATQIAPRMRADETAKILLNQLTGQVSVQASDLQQLVLVGEAIDIPGLASQTKIASYNQEEAITAALKRLSSTGGVALVDIGSHRSLVGIAEYGQVHTQIFPYGVGLEGWDYLRKYQSTNQLRRWLPVDIRPDELENYVANKSIYPDVIPTTPRELAIEQALAKLILLQVATEQPFPWEHLSALIVSGAVLACAGHAPQTIAMILDGLQPTGTFAVYADPDLCIISAGGFLANQGNDDYRLGKTVLNKLLFPLGTVLYSPAHTKHPTTITINTGLQIQQAVQLHHDEVVLVPLPEFTSGTATFSGGHAPQQPVQILGGAVGLVIDGRARPIILAEKDPDRFGQLIAWDKELNAHDQIAPIGENT